MLGVGAPLNVAVQHAVMVSVIMLKVKKQSVFKLRIILLNVKAS
jgi:hypothetical protein